MKYPSDICSSKLKKNAKTAMVKSKIIKLMAYKSVTQLSVLRRAVAKGSMIILVKLDKSQVSFK